MTDRMRGPVESPTEPRVHFSRSQLLFITAATFVSVLGVAWLGGALPALTLVVGILLGIIYGLGGSIA